jgi:hypothetical protein
MSQRVNGSLRASLILLIILFSTLSNSQTPSDYSKFNKAASSSQWLALLHVKNGKPIIKDPKFILSIDEFDPHRELLKTIEFLSLHKNSLQACRFIARAEFIQYDLGINLNFDESSCLEYSVFLAKAPAQKVSIIYASENLTQPSSMLGHSMLAISGEGDSGWVEHGVSFFTELETINLASILWDTLYVGKKGYFVLEPLAKSLNYYLRTEQRNIWQYDLNLTEREKSLFHKHLWELRNLDIDYFFHSHNCATFSFDTLSVARPNLSDFRQSWVTPIDVVRSAENADVIKSIQIYPSSKWKVRMLTDFLTDEELFKIEQLIVNDIPLDFDSILAKEMVSAYNQYDYETGNINKKKWESNKKNWSLEIDKDYSLEMTDYKSPLNTWGDAAYHFSLESSKSKKWLLAGWLPTSHSLEDDNKQFFGETELKLSEIVIKASLDDSSISLYRWPVYTATSLTPRNRLTGGLSGRFSFGFDQFVHRKDETELAAYVTGALGITHKITNDISLYYLGHIGQVANTHKSYAYVSPEIGAYVYEIFNMKSMISLKREFRANSEKINYFMLKQSAYFGDTALVAEASYIEGNDSDFWKVALQYKMYF